MHAIADVVSTWGEVSLEIRPSELIFRVKLWSHGRGHFFAIVDRGRIQVRSDRRGRIAVQMVLSFGKLIGIALLMAVVVGISTSHWSYGIWTFAWLVGVNWVVAFFKAGKHFDLLFERYFGEP